MAVAAGQTITAIGAALSSVASTSTVALPAAALNKANDPTVLLVFTSVTTGLTVKVQGYYDGLDGNSKPTQSSTAVDLCDAWAQTANGAVALPLRKLVKFGRLPDRIRVTCTARTDGTATSYIVTTPDQ